jgi:hypothetical protein
MAVEIAEQPDVLAGLLARADEVVEAGARIATRRPRAARRRWR